MKTSAHVAEKFAAQWGRVLQRVEAEWKVKRARRLQSIQAVDAYIEGVKKLEMKTLAELRRASRRLDKLTE